MSAALRRLEFEKDETIAHGFRATASTLLNESGKWLPDAIEAELAHVGADEVRRIYHRPCVEASASQWRAEEIDQCRI